jgi:hypothetical protein
VVWAENEARVRRLDEVGPVLCADRVAQCPGPREGGGWGDETGRQAPGDDTDGS